MTIIAAILVVLGWMDRWPGPDIPTTLFANALMIQSWIMVPSLDTPGWSIGAEWSAYLIFPFYVAVAYRARPAVALALIVAALPAIFIITQMPMLANQPKRTGLLDIWHYGTVFPAIRCMIVVLMGVAVYRLMQVRVVRATLTHPWAAPLIFAGILSLMAVKNADIAIVALFPALVGAQTDDKTFCARLMHSAPVYRLGVLSYALYLIHNLLNYPLYWVAARLAELRLPLPYLTAMVLFAMIGIALAEAAHRMIELPWRVRLRSLLSARSPREQLKPAG